MQTPVILVVEDEEVTRLNLVSLFQGEGYDVIEAINGDEMHRKLEENRVNLIVMDINLPGKNGLILARELRQKENIGLIFLTGRDTEVDRILGLEIGADDYLTKPFNSRELTIRARNLLGRTSAQPVIEEHKSVLKFNGWTLDENSRNLTSPEGVARRLPKGEYRALRLMLDTPGKIFTREQLIRHMTGRDLRPNDRTVDVTIRRIRKHFETDLDSPELISTIHGEGYRFVGKIDK
ncbi:two-component system response regulator ArcA [Alishewanella tabrizica]|uniref:DNA-binding response regulator n=1 Tax=Alishewanella tabrizica TaxID=671278 RepID=A0ABQ2WGF2_9ALTE|nr:two-component system response regulator ArcA [Alishewanella tabrizica]GGW54092.1 DNA-binding response regulator [Alishewanella tabrizica]